MKGILDFRAVATVLITLVFAGNARSQCPVIAPVPNNSCYQQVIANDSYCCYSGWDGICQAAYDACAPSGSPTTGDCPGAIPICTNNTTFSVDPNGYGAVNELCIGCFSNPSTNPASGNSGCLLSGELNSTWFSITVVSSGSLQFSFGSPGGTNCYDWIMWQYTPGTCAAIAANAQAPVRCNWNYPCSSYTGVGPVPAGGAAGNFEPAMAVTAGQQFIICMSNYSSAYTNVPLAFSGSANIQCIPLSVDYASFTAEDQRGHNRIEWTTETELNCDYYELQRSVDGQIFETIAKVDGHGTTTEPSYYGFDDYLHDDDITYYRLNQVDFDGSADLSPIVAVAQYVPDDFGILKTWPNPADELLSIHFYVPVDADVSLTLLDAAGEVAYSGSGRFAKGRHQTDIGTGRLQPGVYIVHLVNGETKQTEMTRVVVR